MPKTGNPTKRPKRDYTVAFPANREGREPTPITRPPRPTRRNIYNQDPGGGAKPWRGGGK
jgi:hypothetical protein